MSDARNDWREALAATAECIDVARFGEELDAASREHLQTCARCQSELALFRELDSEQTTDDEAAATQWIAAQLQQRAAETANVVPFRAKPLRALYSIAAALMIVVGAGYLIQTREPGLDAIGGSEVYRSTRVELVAPRGELATAPNELQWTPVANATRYHVELVEVDGTVVWSGDTTAPQASLPQHAIAQFAPGKSLLWNVKAFRGTEMLASSETQSVRVSANSLRKTP